MALGSKEYKELSIKEFTRAAEKYENDFAGIYETCKKDYPEILEKLAGIEFHDLLDAGCGPAPLLAMLSKLYPDRHFTGLDLTPAMIEKAREKNLPNVDLVVGDCENLPFAENSFDVIVCCESFHHYPNPQDFFHSVYRCLRKDGILILRDFAVDGPIKWMANHLEMPLANLAGHGDVGVYSEKELREMCRKAKLKVEAFEVRKLVKMNLIARK